MDGENNGWKTLLNWDDLGVPLFLETPIFHEMLSNFVVDMI